MKMFSRRGAKDRSSAVAVLDRERFDGTDEELAAEIAALRVQLATESTHEAESRLIYLLHVLGIRRLAAAGDNARYPEPATDLPPYDGALPEFTFEDLTPELLRAAILRDGCAIVRGLIPRERALAFADEIEQSFAEREREVEGKRHDRRLYDPFVPDPPHGVEVDSRGWIRAGGGVLAMDAPKLACEVFNLLYDIGLPELIADYVGEDVAISLDKTTLRKATPDVAGGWHQDGNFMGDVRAMNLWLSLSRCGDEAPGLDMVPRRLGEMVQSGTDEAMLDYVVSQRMAEQAAGDRPIVRPIFEPGDAVLFDDLFLHKTGSDPAMPKPRYALESWFFGASGFPTEYAPIAI